MEEEMGGILKVHLMNTMSAYVRATPGEHQTMWSSAPAAREQDYAYIEFHH